VKPGAVGAVAVGVPAALLAHALDAAGQLPFVHETAGVRTAMGPATVAAWLLLTAVVMALAASTRPVLVGGPGTLLTAGLPELLSRHDPGAIFEPGALLGALLQWLLLLTLIAMVLVAERVLHLAQRPGVAPFCLDTVLPAARQRTPRRRVHLSLRSRAPPPWGFLLT
jgi:hypothetical protein